MSRLRKTSETSAPAIPDATALYMICDAVARRKELIHGHLYDNGGCCAVGAFWRDNPGTVLNSDLIDEVAGYNDSIPVTESPKVRHKKVLSWLRWRLRVLANPSAARKP